MVLYKQKSNKTVMQLLWINAHPALYYEVHVKPLIKCDSYINLMSSEEEYILHCILRYSDVTSWKRYPCSKKITLILLNAN